MARIVVVGGGIGGLAAALAVSSCGHDVVVLERAGRFAEIGAGIQIAPNGVHALERLGLGDIVRKNAVRMSELRFMDGVTGEHVTSLPLTGQYEERFGNPYVVVHRAELHTMLLRACEERPGIELRAAADVKGYQQHAGSVTVQLSDGTTVLGDAVIGADGIRSAIRAALIGDGAPRSVGITVYRAAVPMAQVPEEIRQTRSVTWWTGPGCHFVHYPIAGGTVLNLAASRYDGGTETFAGVPVSEAHVLERMSALGVVPRRLLELGEDWKSWVLVDRDPVDEWADRRVVLLGDAAHPMLHYAAQGACQALEDAVVLGDLLDCGDHELTSRFEAYVVARRERTARVQRAARDSIALWHAAGQDAEVRNAALRGMSARELQDRVAWMHEGHKPVTA